MSIGTTIKKLRRERDITQEQLAEYLGISFQAVSQWECDRNSPDISQLPLLANIFEVSADVLLGIDIDSKQKKIDAIYNEAKEISYTGKKDQSLEILKKGLHDYPDSYKLMEFYAGELYCKYNNDELKSGKGAEITVYLDKILNNCTDSRIRNSAVATACFLYPRIGRYDEAIKLAKSMTEVFTEKELLSHIYIGTKKFEMIRDDIIGKFSGSIGNIFDFAASKYDDGSPVYSDDEKLALYQKQIEMFALFFDGGDYLYHAQYAEIAHCHAAYIYAGRLDKANTLSHLEQMVEFAIEFDTLASDAVHTSLLAKGSKDGGVWWSDTSNRCFALLSDLSDNKYDFIRADPNFVAIENELEKHARK